MQRWRVFYTAPRAEKKCEERMLEQDVEVFLPKITTKRKWKDRTRAVNEPLFRSYIFAHVDERSRIDVLQIKGIVRSLAFGGKVAEMSVGEIDQLKITQQNPEQLGLLSEWVPAIGNQVLVTDGPMKGLKGEVLQQRGQSYVIIRIEALRQAVKVNVPLAWIKSLESPHLQD